MAYYIRVLSTSLEPLPCQRLQDALAKEQLEGALKVEEGSEQNWRQVSLAHATGEGIAIIERNVIVNGSLVEGELDEFAEEIGGCKPEAAVGWLKRFFPRVRCIYAFQLLRGTDIKNGWDILGEVKNAVWRQAPSIIQADGEGFSNEDGYHILWQFSPSVKGTWWMGVLDGERWVHFQMDLGNQTHREAFWAGKVPQGVAMA